MSTLRITTFLVLGAILLIANIWYLRNLWNTVFGSTQPNAIAPFQIVSETPKDAMVGAAMAHLLRARLGRIRQEMESSARSLADAQVVEPSDIILSPERPLSLVTLPDKVFEPLSLNLTVAGVEVGGLLSRLHRLMVEDRILQIVVEYHGDKAIVVGNADQFGGNPIYVLREADTDKIVTGIAYTLVQREMTERLPEVGALNLDEFESLLSTLHFVAELNRKLALGRTTGDEYNQALEALENLVQKTPRWRALVQLAAQVAENANDTRRALKLYRQASSLYKRDDPVSDQIKQAIARLDASIVTAGVDAPAIPQGSDRETILGQLRKTKRGRQILAMSGVTFIDAESQPRIAILGGRPSKTLLPEGQATFVGTTAPEERKRPFEESYIDNLVRTVQLISPSAQFIFTPSISNEEWYQESEILDAWEALISADPQVLLITLGPMIGESVKQMIRESVSRGIVVVFADTTTEQSYGQPMAYSHMLDQVLVVASLSKDGTPLAYPSVDDDQRDRVFWAPGELIPVYDAENSRINMQGGNIYAAAIAAAIAGQVAAKADDLTLPDLVGLLRESSLLPASGAPPAVLNLEATLEKLEMESAAADELVKGRASVEKQIPDNDPTGLRSVITIDEAGQLQRIKVTVRISHTWIGDLLIVLIGPDGTEITLHDRTGASASNLITSFSSRGIPALAEFEGKKLNGEWTLAVSDLSPRDIGILHEWSLEIVPAAGL